MTRSAARVVAAATAALLIPTATFAIPPVPGEPIQVEPAPPPYEEMVAAVADMVSDGDTAAMVRGKGLDLVNVMWEDTGRYEDSAVGPNISDVTIEVQGGGAGAARRTYLMPVMRNANFADKTADVRLDKIYLPVGNQRGGKLQTVTLRQFLANPDAYLSLPRRGHIKGGSLLARRDSHALVSAQHAFLPVPTDGKATFWPVIFNYASSAQNPGVLTVLVTRQGTSATIIDNTRDTVTPGESWGQRLYFNKDGQRAPLIAERLKDVQAKGTTANGEAAASLGDDANLLMLIQIPLKQRAEIRVASGASAGPGYSVDLAEGAGAAPSMSDSKAGGSGSGSGSGRRSDVDTAVLGNGPTEGKYTELDGLTIERDPRFPVRVTVQFYQATSNGVVGQADIDRMAAQIAKVYAAGDYVGSLVTPGPRAPRRPTAWTGAGPAPANLTWRDFPGLVERAQRWLPFPTALVTRQP
jgi:hypothetical protein